MYICVQIIIFIIYTINLTQKEICNRKYSNVFTTQLKYLRINLGNGRIQTLRSFLCHKQKRISMNSSAYPKFIPRARRLCISQVRDKPRITLYRANVPKRKRQWYQWWQRRLYIYIDLTAPRRLYGLQVQFADRQILTHLADLSSKLECFQRKRSRNVSPLRNWYS